MTEKKFEPEIININDSEFAYLNENGDLFINGASYIEGMDDYEWFFAVKSEYFSILYQKLSGISEPPEDIGNELIKFLQEKGKEVSDLTKICKANDIPHHFSNYM